MANLVSLYNLESLFVNPSTIADTNPALELSSIPFARKKFAHDNVYFLSSFLTSSSVEEYLPSTILISFTY